MLLVIIFVSCTHYNQENHAPTTVEAIEKTEPVETDGEVEVVEGFGSICDDIYIINLEHIVAENLDINDAFLVETSGRGYVATFPLSRDLERLTELLPSAESVWWSDEIPDYLDINHAVSLLRVPGGSIAIFMPRSELEFEKQYEIAFHDWGHHPDTIGSFYTFRNSLGFGGYGDTFYMTIGIDGRLIIHPQSHDGWPSSTVNNADSPDGDMVIEVFVTDGNHVTLVSQKGVLSQISEARENGIRVYGLFGREEEQTSIAYRDRDESALWEWLMNPDNAQQLYIHNTAPEIILDVPAQDVTNDLWERWGIQAFLYCGDVTFISRRGIISELPEFNENEHYFNLILSDDFELQYIMHHEREGSGLWQVLMPNAIP